MDLSAEDAHKNDVALQCLLAITDDERFTSNDKIEPPAVQNVGRSSNNNSNRHSDNSSSISGSRHRHNENGYARAATQGAAASKCTPSA